MTGIRSQGAGVLVWKLYIGYLRTSHCEHFAAHSALEAANGKSASLVDGHGSPFLAQLTASSLRVLRRSYGKFLLAFDECGPRVFGAGDPRLEATRRLAA